MEKAGWVWEECSWEFWESRFELGFWEEVGRFWGFETTFISINYYAETKGISKGYIDREFRGGQDFAYLKVSDH